MFHLSSWRRAARVSLVLCSAVFAGPVFAQFDTDPFTVADFNLPPQDEQGWTILTPASDSRLIYVDPVNGNDANSTYYTPGAAQVGPNPQAPVGAVVAVKTLARAHALAREDQPDWILLKAGGVWENQSLDTRRGRSPTARAVVTSYGVGPRPELRTGTFRAIHDDYLMNIIIQGIRFWAHTRDTDGPYFTGYEGSVGFNLYTRVSTDARKVRDALIEDCVFRAYRNNVITASSSGGNTACSRFVMRRSIISGNYEGFSNSDHSQGMYHIGSGQPLQPTILLQENTFDHNGWRIQQLVGGQNVKTDGQATMYNHNTYFTGARGVIFQGNFFLRASSIGNKWTSQSAGGSRWVIIENNFYLEGEIGVSMGGNDPLGPKRFQDIRIRNNVFSDLGRTNPTKRSLAWGIDALDWNTGSITNNLLIHQRSGIGNTWALAVNASSSTDTILVAGNVVANMASGSQLVRLLDGANVKNVRFENNTIQTPSAVALVTLVTGGYSFGGTNRYFSTAASGSRFRVNSASRDLAGWISATGDMGAVFEAPNFPDPTRDLERYSALLGFPATAQGFINALYGQSKSNWNPALTAPALNAWLRAGFGMTEAGPAVPMTALETWRDTRFGSRENEGAAADAADYDGDGIANLIEYATGTDPTKPNQNPVQLGKGGTGGDRLTLTFNRIDDPAITYTVEAANGLETFAPVAAYNGGVAGTYTYVDSVPLSTAPGARRFLRLRTSYGDEFSAWASRDIGSAGGGTFTSHGFGAGETAISAGGADIQGTSDAFRFVSVGDIQGDGEVVARVVSLTNTNAWAKAGVMIRNGLDANAANVAVFVSPNGSVSLQYRISAGGNTTAVTASGLAAPRWLRLVRTGNSFSGYHSANGTAWTQIGSTVTVTIPTAARMGLAVTSHNTSSLTTAVLDNLTATH